MWTYQVSTGSMKGPQGTVLATGYSGNGASINQPAAEGVKGHGPIPVGQYAMGPWFDHPEKGVIVTRLEPHPENDMRGRDGFMIHGDNSLSNHTASDGCIIMPRFARQVMSQSTDQELEVID